jgi:formylglycine-generating enzyme required for sulfatase activity
MIFNYLRKKVKYYWGLFPRNLYGSQVLIFFVLLGNWNCFDPDSVLSVSVSKVDASGLGIANGQAIIQVKGGSPPYVYQWSNGGGSDSSRFNLLPGFYNVVVVDAIGVIDSVSFEIGPNIQWVSIPAGTFTMGSPSSNEAPQHSVTLSGFKMSKYEVTFAQYDAFCDATGRTKPSDEGWGRGNRPVINVDWNDATAFAQWMGCRLPTEAEWEYACRAGTTSPFNTGSCLSSSEANYDGNYPYSTCAQGTFLGKPQPAGSYAPNAWGLYDMHGNVWEWCSDWYGDYSSGAQTNPNGPSSGSDRVLRGGGWRSAACRSAGRGSGFPFSRTNDWGFRLVVPN